MKNPWVAAILNFIVWGLGYLYNGKRKGFGAGWLIAYVPAHLPIYYLGWTFYFTQAAGALILTAHFIISLLLAYDGYKEAS